MPLLKSYDLFISHAWRYSQDYLTLSKNLRDYPNFKSRNYSVPEHDPLIDPNTRIGRNRLIELLDNQIRPVNIVLIISGMYASHSFWMEKEIEIANSYNKPIIGIKPRNQQRVPIIIQNSSREMVGWSTPNIINKIRFHSL